MKLIKVINEFKELTGSMLALFGFSLAAVDSQTLVGFECTHCLRIALFDLVLLGTSLLPPKVNCLNMKMVV